MEQIQQHEWKKWRGPVYYCPHCNCFYHDLHVKGRMYKPTGMGKPTLKEPACIIREIKTTENGSNSAT